ncbi:hypothetical protein NDU88_004217 [Pleurodeles waltl]|uniref:Uncharacterized protein n=1 Tax=Pleurodeles waltl TaxID=8319 RepID=A0AAV7M7A9_PLEWA|nr:hypothetical protein NDU88_004217 [Pleurodeles waltl]
MGSWAHSWCLKFVRSVRSLCPPKCFTYFRSSFPSVPSLLWAHTSSHPRAFYPVHCSVFSARPRPPFSVLCKSLEGALRASFLVPQCYFLIVDVGPASTPPVDRALFCVLSARGRFIRCTAACSPPSRREAPLPRPLQVPWGPAWCLIPHSPALLPRCGCRACAGIAGSPLTPSRPQRTRVLYPVYCSAFSVRLLLDVLYKSRAVLRTSFLFHQRCFLVVGAGPARHRRRTTHSAAPPAHMGALSNALQHVLCPSGGRPPFNNLYNSPSGSLHTSILAPQRYFLVVGTGPAQTPPVDRALRRTLSARGHFVRCTVAYFLPRRKETTLQRPLQVPWRPAPLLVPHSLVLLPRYRCWARTVTAGRPRSQRTQALYPMHCSVFSAKSGRVRPSMCSSSKRRRQGRVTMRVPGLAALAPCRGPHTPGSDSPSFLWTPGAPGQQSRRNQGALPASTKLDAEEVRLHLSGCLSCLPSKFKVGTTRALQ